MASTSLASRTRNEKDLPLHNEEEAELWLLQFEAKCRVKNITDNKDHNNKMSHFIAEVGTSALRKIKNLSAPKKLDDLRYDIAK